jgi:hypothetical protein
MLNQTEPNVVWKPIEGSSQEIAIDTRCNETLFCGPRGPGKTDAQLMRFRRRVGLGYGKFWRGVIFDREYKNLDDVIAKADRWFPKFNDGAQYLSSTNSLKWVWPTGEQLLFRSIKKREDYDDYHGQEYPFIGWNELTKFPTAELYDMMMSCNRSSFTPEKDGPRDSKGKLLPIEEIPLEVFSTCNPWGAGHNWVKRRFIDVAPYGTVVRNTRNIFNPRTQHDEPVTRTQVTIFGSYRENIYLAPEYIAGLDSIKDENRRKAWLLGDWNVVSGGALDDVWDQKVHVIPRFPIPSTWHLDRSFDWGSTHPFSVGWWAETNGEEIQFPDGRKFAPAPGSLIQIAEWYGTNDFGTNEGLKLSAKQIAIGIRQREQTMLNEGWITSQPWPGPADNQIRDVREKDVETIEKKMQDQGVRWTESDKSPGSRRNGLELLRGCLENASMKEGPGIYFMNNCRASIATIPVLPRDEDKLDDVDTTAEDHPYDMTRYRVLKGANRIAKSIKVKYPH